MSLPAGNYQPVEISLRDAGNEIGSSRFYGLPVEIDDATGNIEELNTLLTAYLAKQAAITLGQRTKVSYLRETTYTTTQPTNGAARELKLFVQLQNTVTGRQLGFSLPTLDPTIPAYVINKNVKDAIALTTPAGITEYITALNALAVDPIDGNPAHVVGLRVIGRNN